MDQNKDGESAWHMAVDGGHIEVLETLWGWPKRVQIQADDIRSPMLLAQNKSGKTGWKLALRNGRIMVFEKLLDLAKKCN